MKRYTKSLVVLSLTATILTLISCHNSNLKNRDDKASTDYQGAVDYEFNMMKNPATGKIPEGSFENEKIQARFIVEQQLQNRVAGGTSYTFQGPNNLGGRTRSLQYDVRYNGTTNQVIIAGGVSGGIYKSIDNGATWVRKSSTGEHFSCTSLAQDTRVGNMDTWYYTVGEASGNSASETGALYGGNGVYKSTDNGETWSRLVNSNTTALESFSTSADFISKLVVNPTNGDVYIACVSAIRRSTDGGVSWGNVLNGTLSGTNQLTEIAVTSTGVFYAGFSGTHTGGIDGVWRSTTGASGSWTRIAGPTNTPLGWNAQGAYGRVVLAVAPSNENIVYALYAISPEGSGINGEFYRYDASLTTWTTLTLPDEPGGPLSGNDPFTTQGGYDQVVSVKPDDANSVFIGGTNAYRSIDGGASWTRIGGYNSPASYALYPNSHPDIHGFAFQPTNSSIMLCYNDGGIQRTTNDLAATVSWTQINNGYRTYQYYYVDIDPRTGNDKVIGGAQDNGSTRNAGGTGTTFEPVLGGDGVSVGLNVPIAGVQTEFVGSQLGSIVRRASTLGNGFGTSITPTGESNSGLFVTLFKLDPDNTTNLYYANDNLIYRTASAATVTSTTWTSMSGVGASVGTANDISALATTRGAYSAATSSLFIGTSNGKLFRLDDPINTAATTAPVDISSPAFTTGYVSSVSVNPRNDDTVLVTVSNYGVVSAFWTGNANAASPTWTSVEGNLTLPSYRSSTIVITNAGVEYFVGTSAGLYYATGLPASPTWAQESSAGIGNAVVSSLALRTSDNTLLVGTHGYGMWTTQLALSILPITLNEFTGTKQDKTVLIKWSTGSELNSKHFELEKSYDGNTFRKITTIAAAGNSSSTKNYQFIDKELLLENNYYRLKSIDLDGKFTTSSTVLIKNNEQHQMIVINGNPFSTNISLTLLKKPATNGVLTLIDNAGRIVARQTLPKGSQQILFTLPVTLAKGSYYLKAEVDGNIYTSTVLKK
ncbi:MAG: T9SS type A sorting domain-containing protein [Ferruginibacter sp.]